MKLGVDPKVDYAFKHVFGRDATRPILIDVVDNVLQPSPGHRILDIELLNPLNPKEALDDKLSILDIKARDQAGRQFNVEMQMLALRAYDKRILYYFCKLHQQQLHEGERYGQLKPTISISFLNHVLFPQVSDYHLRFRLLEHAHHFSLTDDVEFHVFELPKFSKSLAELAGGLDKWLYFLRHAETMDLDELPTELRAPLVLRAFEELKMLTQSDLERERYEARRKAQLDQNSFLDDVECLREEIRQAAREVGRQQGRREEKTGFIGFCERLLNRPQTPMEQLAALSLEDLTRLADELQKQVLEQR